MTDQNKDWRENWWLMDLESLRREYSRLRFRHERVLSTINFFEDELMELLYQSPDPALLNSVADRFFKQIDEILEPKEQQNSTNEKFYVYSWGKTDPKKKEP